MRRFCLYLVIILSAVSCDRKDEFSVERQIGRYVVDNMDGIDYFNVKSLNHQYNVTFGQELERKRKLFELKQKFYAEKVVEARTKHHPKALAQHQMELLETEDILKRIEDYRQKNLGCKDSVIYGVFCFSGEGEGKEKKVTLKDHYAVISADSKVYNICGPGENPTVNMSIALPGYLQEVLF